MKQYLLVLISVFMTAALTSCAVMSKFDQNSYDSAQSLKSESLELIANAGKDPIVDKIDALQARLSAQLSYEQGKGKPNVISAKQWDILISEDHDLLGKLLKEWESGKKFSAPYLLEKTNQISDGWNQILRLEGAKTR